MPTITINWIWEEAFDKFGFDDGDGMVMTHEVERALEGLGYTVWSDSWGCHNTIVTHLSKDGKDLLEGVTVGYDDPRVYLPDDLIEALDEAFDEACDGAFLRELTELTRKHRVTIAGCGCCGSPFLDEISDQQVDGKYSTNSDGSDLTWGVDQ